MAFLDEEFKKFIELDADRVKFIQNYLEGIGLNCPIIPIDGKNHLYVSFPKNQYNPLFKIKTVIAHYDRVPQTPGANDNSSSVYSFLRWAERLATRKGTHNIRMIFTDGEELSSEGVASQGAFGLAKLFKRLGITNEDVFVFDCMGRGNIPVLTETILPKNAPRSFVKDFCDLEERAESVIMNTVGRKWMKLPCNYSDNAGFIANGIPAVAFTILPGEEIDSFMRFGEKPLSWKLLHTMQDDFSSLNESAFEITAAILDNIANLKTVRK